MNYNWFKRMSRVKGDMNSYEEAKDNQKHAFGIGIINQGIHPTRIYLYVK